MSEGETSGDEAHRPGGWPEGLREQLDEVRQGHVIVDIPTFFHGSVDHPLSSMGTSALTTAPLIVGIDYHESRSAMILTQACDLMKPQIPWVTVVPVYDASQRIPRSQHGQVTGGQIMHFVHLTADWASPGLWVADLRLEVPIEKSVLLGAKTREAFADEADYARLAERLSENRARAAIADSCLDLVVVPLFERVRHCFEAGTDLNVGVRELRVQCDNQTDPKVVTLFVVAKEGDLGAVNITAWETLVAELHGDALGKGITILGPDLTTLSEMTAAEYLTSHPIRDTASS